MNRPLATLTLALICASLPGECFAQYWYCQFTPNQNDKKIFYFSEVFALQTFRSPGKISAIGKAKRAFNDYVSAKYSETPGTVGCARFDNAAAAEASLMRNEDLVSNQTNKGKLVATGWRYSAGP